MQARIYEQGNGLPAEGDYCGGQGQLWRVESIDSRIQTDPAGNWVYATVSEADWEDCADADEHTARVVIEPARDRDDELACDGDWHHDRDRDDEALDRERL